MLHTIKNSFFSKCLQALLICYFLISSINIPNSIDHIFTGKDDIHSLKGMTCHILKKIFECDSLTEGMDECETGKTKANKTNKGFLCYEYLMPSNICLAKKLSNIAAKNKSFIDNPIFTFGYYGKIHLPPPELV